jgi:hypothetical protein
MAPPGGGRPRAGWPGLVLGARGPRRAALALAGLGAAALAIDAAGEAAVEGEIEHQPIGEPRTLAGIVEPSVLDRRVAHRPWEDPAWLD